MIERDIISVHRRSMHKSTQQTKGNRCKYQQLDIWINTLRPKDVPGKCPKLVLDGLIGVASACVYDGFKEVGEEDWYFIHWSQSCVILDKAVFSRSEYHKIIYDF